MKPSIAFPILLVLLLYGRVDAEHADQKPGEQVSDDAPRRRASIQEELDRNQLAVTDLYKLLDVTPKTRNKARRYLETQISQFDDRSAILFDELDLLDREKRQRHWFLEIQLQASQLHEEARQLRRTGHLAPAVMREVKARALEKSLQDGTWKLQRNGKHEIGAQQDRGNLLLEVKNLREETRALRREVAELRSVVTELRQHAVNRKPQ